MKIIFFIFGFFLFSFNGNAQFFNIDFVPVIKVCPEDSSGYFGFEGWDIFQTENDTIDGQRMSHCITVDILTNSLELEKVIPGKPVFIQSNMVLDFELNPDILFMAFFNLSSIDAAFCECNESCSQDNCVSMNLEIASVYQGDTVTSNVLIEDPLFEDRFIDFSNCFVTEKFEDQKIKSCSITLAFEDFETNGLIRFSNVFIEESFMFYGEEQYFTNNVVSDGFSTGLSYLVPSSFFNEFFFGHVVALHKTEGIPSFDNTHYYDITPEDSTSQKIINIILRSEESMFFQSWTALRGALVSQPNNDTLRHRLNIVNEGATLCLPNIVEIIMSGENQFIHKSGVLDFQSSQSCIQFRDNSKLVLNDGSQLDYGNKGIGLLAMHEGTSIELNPNSELNFNGKMVLFDKDDKSKISIDLDPNESLTFGFKSKITSFQTPNEVQLDIYMNGGHLNTKHLDPESLEFLNLIYPDSEKTTNNELIIYPNPTRGIVNIFNPFTKKETSISIFNIEGQIIEKIHLENHQTLQLDVSNYQSGLYFLKGEYGTVSKMNVIH